MTAKTEQSNGERIEEAMGILEEHVKALETNLAIAISAELEAFTEVSGGAQVIVDVTMFGVSSMSEPAFQVGDVSVATRWGSYRIESIWPGRIKS